MTDDRLTFAITFHTPFLVSGGLSDAGSDVVSRPDTLLPASSLKGAFRHAAEHTLGLDPALVRRVFGGPGGSGAVWAWSDAIFSEPPIRTARSRIRLDAAGMVVEEAMATTEEVWPRRGARLYVDRLGDVDNLGDHRNTLLAAAFGVTAVGMWRNRGQGTISVRPQQWPTGTGPRALASWVTNHRSPAEEA